MGGGPRRVHTALAVLAAVWLAGCGSSDDANERLGEAASELGQPLLPEGEPNGAAAQANPIGNDVVVIGNVFGNGDQDYYSFQAAAGDRVYASVMSAFSANASTDADLDILGTDGTTVLETDDLNGSIGTLAPTIAGTPISAPGTYYVRVRHFSATGQQRPYHLHFRVQSGMAAAEVEPNDMAPQPLPPSGWITGTISAANDVDVYSLTLNAGDTLSASLDLDPTRDGTEFNGALAIGPFAGTFLQVNDSGTTGPDSEAIFATVKTGGTYGVGVTGAAPGDYGLSVSVHPAAPSPGCTTYTSADVPKVIPTGPGQVTSTITVPGAPRIVDADVSIQLNHTSVTDLDVRLTSPAGNTNGLFTDVGSTLFPNVDITIDDEAAYPAASFTLLNGVAVQPENAYRMHWLDGENGGGTWTLVIDDDFAANGGTLTGWSLTLCEAPIPAISCSNGNMPVTPLNATFESGADGFTHSGAGDTWAVGTPTAAPITTCNGGTQCFKTNLGGTYSASSNQELVSPPIDLSQAVAPLQLRWAMKYQMENATNDHAWVEIREVGGLNARRVWQFLDATMTDSVGSPATAIQESAGWGTHFANIDSYAGKQVEVVFHVDSNASVQLAGLAVDDVSIVGCPSSVCGNGTPEPGEACDDGNLVDGDGCDSNCTASACGNGVTAPNEGCDDGNLVDGDGCDSNCTLTACGNGVPTAGETCDDGNAVEGDGCDSNCTASACGNGVTAPNEGCDDGNLVDDDGCDSNCTVTACGNGIVTGTEVCDDGNVVEGDGCDTNCSVSACGNGIAAGGEGCDDGNLVDDDGCDSNCTTTGCGNGVTTPPETCDDGNVVNDDGCDSNCTVTGCGNGVQTGTEACDDGNTTDGDGCDSDCTVTGCGNSIVTAPEECDDGNTTDGDGCDSNCTNTACGNGVVTAPERCDDGNTNGGDGCDANCLDEGMGGAGGGGSGGAGGNGGSATGGNGGAGANGGSGSSTGGSGTSSGGEGGGDSTSTGTPPKSGSSGDDGGCGCSVPGEDRAPSWGIVAALGGLAALRLRRRRAR